MIGATLIMIQSRINKLTHHKTMVYCLRRLRAANSIKSVIPPGKNSNSVMQGIMQDQIDNSRETVETSFFGAQGSITKTRPCNIQQYSYFTAVKMFIFR